MESPENLGLLPLSACFIAKNEADRIGPAIAAVRGLCADIVVVLDTRTSDNTATVAQAAGARVIPRDWTGFGEQKRFAETSAAHDWILSLDADEVISPALAAEIRALFAAATAHDFYRLNIVEVYPGRAHPRPFASSTNVVRLFNRRKGMTSQSAVHDRVEIPAGSTVGQLNAPVLHYSIRSLAHLRDKYDDYTTLQAKTLKKPKWLLAIRLATEFPVTFVQYYLGQRHITGGAFGLQVAAAKAAARWHRIRKMWLAA